MTRAAQRALALAQQEKSAWTRADLVKHLGRVLPHADLDHHRETRARAGRPEAGEPLHAWRGENEEPRPRPYLIPDTQPADDNDPAGHGTRTNGWFHRAASRSAPERPSPRDGAHPLSLTGEQIDYFVGREKIFDALLDEQDWHDTVLFDQAIDDDRYWRNGRLCDRPMDAEPEIDDPEIG